MTNSEIDKKIHSFSGHNGLGKTYHHYEIIDTALLALPPKNAGDGLPQGIVIKIRPDRRTELLLVAVMACICLLIFARLKQTGSTSHFVWVAGVAIVITLRGLDAITRGKRKISSRLEIDRESIRFNKDEFPLEDISTCILKKDLSRNNKLVKLWVMVVLRNGDIYSYAIPNRYSWLRIRGKYKLEELLYHYQQDRSLISNLS
jgi:hypothetical protein